MRINRDSLSPSQSHEANAVCDLRPHTLQCQKLSMRGAIAFPSFRTHFSSGSNLAAPDWTFGVAKAIEPARFMLVCNHDRGLVNVFGSVTEA